MKAIAQTGTIFEDGTYEKEEVADDPFVARFLSPDPFIQSPGNSQNYNRYSYALNNPLKYTDPSGYMFRGADMGDNPGGFVNNGFKLPQNGTMGSGNHWSDGMMGEYYNFLFGGSKKFDDKYGVGAHNIAWSIWSNPKARDLWSKGTLTLNMVRETEDVDEAVARVQKQGEYRGTVFFSLTESGHYKYFGYNDSKGNQNIFSPVLKNSQGIIAQILVGEVADFGYYYFSSNLPSLNGEFPTITSILSEYSINGYGFSYYKYTKSVAKGNSPTIINYDMRGNLQSVGYKTNVGTFTNKLNGGITYSNGTPLSVGIDNQNYTIGLSIPIGNNQAAGFTFSADKTMVNNAIKIGLYTAVTYSFPPARIFVPL